MIKLSNSKFLQEEHYEKYFITEEGKLFKFLKSSKTFKEIKGSINPDGYLRVDLRDRINKKGKMFFMHNLMANVFLDYNGEIDHIDRNKLNNNITNIRKTTRSENNLNKSKENVRTKRKTYDRDIEDVRLLKEIGLSNVKIAERLGITYQQVRTRLKKCRD